MSRSRAYVGLLVLAGSLGLGCAVPSLRGPAREITEGALEALKQPEDPLIAKLRKLLDREVDAALTGPAPKEPGDTLGRILSGAIEAVGERLASDMPSMRREIVAIVSATVRAVGADARAELERLGPALGTFLGDALRRATEDVLENKQKLIGLTRDVARTAGREFMRGATEGILDVLQERIGPDGRGPLSTAAAAASERSIKVQMREVVAALTDALPTVCPPENRSECLHALVQSYTRAAAAGMTEGLASGGTRLLIWPIVAVGAAGLLFGVLLAWLLSKVIIRWKGKRGSGGE